MANIERDSFVFYRSFYEAIDTDDLSDSEKALAYKAIFEYALNGNIIEIKGIPAMAFKLAKPQLDANQKRFTDGKKGGRPPKNGSSINEKTTGYENKKPLVINISEIEKPNVNDNDNVNVNVNVNESVINNTNSPPPFFLKNEIDLKIENQEKEKSCAKKEKDDWNTKPTLEDTIELDEFEIGKTVEMVRIIKKIEIDHQRVKEMFHAFKIQNFTGQKYYPHRGEVFTHFLNWIKYQENAKRDNQNKSKREQQQNAVNTCLQAAMDGFTRAAGQGSEPDY